MKIIINILNELHPEENFTQSDDFIMDGILDSFDVITLVTEFEEKLSITIDGLDIIPDNFSSLETIKKMLIKNGAKDEF